jgi:hypothetical protein
MSQEPPVAENASASRWNVEERAWKQELPNLPDEVIALLATPIVVTASALVRNASVPSAAPVPAEAPVRDVAPRFLPPEPPQREPARRRLSRSRTAARIA